VDLPRKLDHIVIFLIYLYINIYEAKLCLSCTERYMHDLGINICMSIGIPCLGAHKISQGFSMLGIIVIN
jgi:hypothetical protein